MEETIPNESGRAIAADAPMTCDVLIAGCGVAGLYAALNLPTRLKVVMLSKGAVDECDSMLAQGGMCVLPEADDYEAFFADTLRAGHDENRRESVDIMIRSSRSVLNDLIALGADFNRTPEGELDFTREGAHSRPRIVYHADISGKEITSTLLAAVRRLSNVSIMEHVAMLDVLEENGACRGVLATRVPEEDSIKPADELQEDQGHGAFEIRATYTLMATGGIGGVYDHSTNFPQLTGDACYVAAKHGIAQEHLDYVQIHPTGLHSPQPGRTFLISESCRGEGAVLLNAAGERFTDELQPRDVVAAAIREQMKADDSENEWLSFAPVPRDVVTGHFANIRARCLEDGRDILDEPIPVVPTQHYFMGGVRVDRDGRTSMPGLFAAGETACNGVHGKNRLASNSLLEALVWGKRAAFAMLHGTSAPVEVAGEPALDGLHRVAFGLAPYDDNAADGASSADAFEHLAIDELCAAAGTAVDGPMRYGDAPLDIDAISPAQPSIDSARSSQSSAPKEA